MTTPRDDIAELSERLRRSWIGNDGYLVEPSRREIEAATALDALQARVKELEAERDVLESSHRTVGKHLANEGERRIRAEQERDEAYERAVQAIRGASSLDENGYIVTKDAAIKAIRRLAAGAEKEKRE